MGFLRKNGVFEKVVFTLAWGFGNFGGKKEDFVFKRLSKWKLKILGISGFLGYFGHVWSCSEDKIFIVKNR